MKNKTCRSVIYTGSNLQLVLMKLAPGEEIGSEMHADNDQFVRIEMGKEQVVIDGKIKNVGAGAGIVVPPGASHDRRNNGQKPLKLYTIYGPPNHLDCLRQATRRDAEKTSETIAGIATEEAH